MGLEMSPKLLCNFFANIIVIKPLHRYTNMYIEVLHNICTQKGIGLTALGPVITAFTLIHPLSICNCQFTLCMYQAEEDRADPTMYTHLESLSVCLYELTNLNSEERDTKFTLLVPDYSEIPLRISHVNYSSFNLLVQRLLSFCWPQHLPAAQGSKGLHSGAMLRGAGTAAAGEGLFCNGQSAAELRAGVGDQPEGGWVLSGARTEAGRLRGAADGDTRGVRLHLAGSQPAGRDHGAD